MEHEYQHAIPLSIMIIWAKAKSLFGEQNAIDPDPKLLYLLPVLGGLNILKDVIGFHNLK
jgi:hypothetical protein